VSLSSTENGITRIDGLLGVIRLFYFARTERRFVILHGIVKKSGKTPRNELETAMRRMQDMLEREE